MADSRFYCSMATSNLTSDDVLAFVQQWHEHLKHPLLLLWDRFSGHKQAARLLRNRYGTQIAAGFYQPMRLNSTSSSPAGTTPLRLVPC
jgi:hypothetical protein